MSKASALITGLFIFLVVIAALRNPNGFATDIKAGGGQVTGFSTNVLGMVPQS